MMQIYKKHPTFDFLPDVGCCFQLLIVFLLFRIIRPLADDESRTGFGFHVHLADVFSNELGATLTVTV